MAAFQSVVPEKTVKIVARLTPGTDLFEGIREICRHHEVECGAVDTALGSLTSATVVCISPDESSPSGASYREPLNVKGPLELVSACGTIGTEGKSGERSIHVHGTVAVDEAKAYFGHFVDDGRNRVLATVEIAITKFIGMRWIRGLDEETGFHLFKPAPHNRSGEGGGGRSR